MKVLLVLAHPDAGSFNHAIAWKVAETLSSLGHEVLFHDLCAEGFDPLLPAREIPGAGAVDPVVERHCGELVEAGGLVFVHPNWWGQQPAVLKGVKRTDARSKALTLALNRRRSLPGIPTNNSSAFSCKCYSLHHCWIVMSGNFSREEGGDSYIINTARRLYA